MKTIDREEMLIDAVTKLTGIVNGNMDDILRLAKEVKSLTEDVKAMKEALC